jgi:hypothetical protein
MRLSKALVFAGIVFLMTLALVGCAGQGKVRANIWMADLTLIERSEADRLERVMARVLEECQRQPRARGPAPRN